MKPSPHEWRHLLMHFPLKQCPVRMPILARNCGNCTNSQHSRRPLCLVCVVQRVELPAGAKALKFFGSQFVHREWGSRPDSRFSVQILPGLVPWHMILPASLTHLCLLPFPHWQHCQLCSLYELYLGPAPTVSLVLFLKGLLLSMSPLPALPLSLDIVAAKSGQCLEDVRSRCAKEGWLTLGVYFVGCEPVARM